MNKRKFDAEELVKWCGGYVTEYANVKSVYIFCPYCGIEFDFMNGITSNYAGENFNKYLFCSAYCHDKSVKLHTQSTNEESK